MGWADAPTKPQLSALSSMISNKTVGVKREEIKEAMDWLKEHATRRQVSDEMGRIRLEKSLTRDEVFGSDIWVKYLEERSNG